MILFLSKWLLVRARRTTGKFTKLLISGPNDISQGACELACWTSTVIKKKKYFKAGSWWVIMFHIWVSTKKIKKNKIFSRASFLGFSGDLFETHYTVQNTGALIWSMSSFLLLET